jgi:hypothetical protein
MIGYGCCGKGLAIKRSGKSFRQLLSNMTCVLHLTRFVMESSGLACIGILNTHKYKWAKESEIRSRLFSPAFYAWKD